MRPLVAASLAGIGVVLAAVVKRRHHDAVESSRKWLVLTIDSVRDPLVPLPEPLARFGDALEVESTPAPRGQGTEVRVRLAPGGRRKHTRDQVRLALRESKQLIEVGEVLRRGDVPHGPRPATISGRLFDALRRGSRRKGML